VGIGFGIWNNCKPLHAFRYHSAMGT
jgi:hypothetical protein